MKKREHLHKYDDDGIWRTMPEIWDLYIDDVQRAGLSRQLLSARLSAGVTPKNAVSRLIKRTAPRLSRNGTDNFRHAIGNSDSPHLGLQFLRTPAPPSSGQLYAERRWR